MLQLGRNRAYHTGREAVLQIENVFNGVVESIGPEMRRGGRINKLGSDANPIIGSTDAAFEHVAHAQFATDLLHINRTAFVSEARIASDYEQLPKARQGRDDLLNHPVSKILLLPVTAHIVEGQHGDRWFVRKR